MYDIKLLELDDVLAYLYDGRIMQIHKNKVNKKLYSAIYNSRNVKSILCSTDYDETKILILHANNKISYYIYDEKKMKLQLVTYCKFIKKIYFCDNYFYAIDNDGTPYFLKPNKNGLSLRKINQNSGQCTQRIVDIVFYNEIISVKTILVGEKGKLYLCSFSNENVTCSESYHFSKLANDTIMRAICANDTLAIVTKAKRVILLAIKISRTITVTKIDSKSKFGDYKALKDIAAENDLFAFLFEGGKVYLKGKFAVEDDIFNMLHSKKIDNWFQSLLSPIKKIKGKIVRIYLIESSLYILDKNGYLYQSFVGDVFEVKCKLIKKLPFRSIDTFQKKLRGSGANYYNVLINTSL